MARNRYVKDYRLLEHFGENGRVRTGYEYIGDPYRFCAGEAQARASLKKSLALCAGGWILWLLALTQNTQVMRSLFSSLSFAFAALPLGMLTSLLIGTLSAKGTLEHRHADKLNIRYPALTVILMLLLAAVLVWDAVLLVRGAHQNTGDLIFAVCACLLLADAALLFRSRDGLRAEAVPPQEREEQKTE